MEGECRPRTERSAPARRSVQVGWCRALPRAALAPDLLVELHPVATLGGVSPLLAPDLADPAEELVTVPSLGGQATLAAGLCPAHLHLLGHVLPFRPDARSGMGLPESLTPQIREQHNLFGPFRGVRPYSLWIRPGFPACRGPIDT